MSITVDEDIVNVTGALNTDSVTELTPAAGVTVDGLLIKDGAIGESGSPVSNVFASAATFSGTVDMSSNNITNVADPVNPGDAANKNYVDSLSAGLDPKASVRLATTTDLASNASLTAAPSYNPVPSNGQFTATLAVSDVFTVDSVTLGAAEDGSRLLIKDEVDATRNGIYTTLISGTSLTLTRASDHDGTPSNEVSGGNHFFVEAGTINANSGWVLSGVGELALNTDNVNFVQFTGAGQITAGTGLSKTGNTINLDSPVAVANGGTGATTLTSGQVLVGNGVGAVDLTKTAPTGDFVGTTDTQTLSNKTLVTPQIQDSDASHAYTLQPGNLTTNVDLNLPVLAANDTIVTEDVAQTLTNKTLEDTSTTFRQSGSAGADLIVDLTGATDPSVLTVASAQTTNRTATIPPLAANDSFVFEDQTQTLTNKTLTDITNSVAASEIQVAGTNVSINTTAPSGSGEVLLTTSATAAGWAPIASGAFPQTDRYYSGYSDDGATGIDISGGFTDVTWDVDNRVDATYTHSTVTNPAEITINTTGDYLVDVDIGTYINGGGGTNRSHSEARIQLDPLGGGAFATVAGTTGLMYNRTANRGYGFCSIKTIISANATDIIKVQAGRVAGTSTVRTRNEACRIRISRA